MREQSGLARRSRAALADPGGLGTLARVLRGLPRLDVALSDGPAGRVIAQHAGFRRRGIRHHRIAQAVLALPKTRDEYLVGRRRQAVRTNLRRATDQGISVMPIFGSGPTAVAEEWLHRPFPDPDSAFTLSERMYPPEPDARGWLAVDPEMVPLALGVISVDVELAQVHTLLGMSHYAGWLLHTQLVCAAIECGARYMWMGTSPLLLNPGLRYFQRRLGYEVFHLSVRPLRGASRAGG